MNWRVRSNRSWRLAAYVSISRNSRMKVASAANFPERFAFVRSPAAPGPCTRLSTDSVRVPAGWMPRARNASMNAMR